MNPRCLSSPGVSLLDWQRIIDVVPTLVVNERPDFRFDVLVDGEARHVSITWGTLDRQLAAYNIVGDSFKAFLNDLVLNSVATAEIPLGKFEQR